MLTNLLKFSDFLKEKVFEDNPSQNYSSQTQKKFFSSHYLERTAGFWDPEVMAGKSRVVPMDDKNKDGFVLTQNLLNEDGTIIEDKTLDKIIQNFVWSYDDLKKELSNILSKLGKSSKVEQFLINQKNILQNQWGMFLGNVCLVKSGQKFYLDFRWSGNQNYIGGTLWAAGSGFNPGAKTILVYTIGKNGDFLYDKFLRTQIGLAEIKNQTGYYVKRRLSNAEINKIQLLYPFGKDFTLEIDLDLSPSEILQSIRNRISSAQAETPVLNKKTKLSPVQAPLVDKDDFVPEDIFDFFSRGDIWFSKDNLYFRNEKILDIIDAIEKGEIKKWDNSKNDYSIPNNSTFFYKEDEQDKIQKKLENLFWDFYLEDDLKYSSISNTNLKDENFEIAFQNLKSNFNKFRKKIGPDFEEMNRKMVKNLESLEERETQILSFSEFLAEKKDSKKKNNPCWQGYRKVGLKTKNGRSVPNCVPIKN